MQRHHLIAVALVLATLFSFEPVRHNGLVNFDDRVYISENPHVQNGLSAREFAWAFNLGYASNWHPLTWFSHMLDVSLWGMHPRGHHLTNVVLHAASVVLLFLLLRRMTNENGKSAFVAAAFAVHPLHVESVAWISERKDVLSTLLGLGSLWAWVAWTRKGGAGRYVASIALFALGLMAKPMLVSFPFLLLLLDLWPLRRIAPGARPGAESSAEDARRPVRALLLEKTPFFVLAALSCYLTLAAQSRGIVDATALPLSFRFGNAACAYVAYLWRALWPTRLSVFYPYYETLSITKVALCGLFLLGSTVLVLRQARARPWLAVGWLWWIGVLVPVIGLVQVGRQSMADRYMYVPLVGLAILVAWGAGPILSRRFGQTASAAIAVTVVGVWIVLTRAQVAVWKDDLSLFGHASAVTEKNDLAHAALGFALSEAGRLDEALIEFGRALEYGPRNPGHHNDVGMILENQGRIESAIESYREALKLDPDMVAAHRNLANALEISGRFEEAVPHFEKLLAPGGPQAHNDYGVALAKQGRVEEALKQFSEALRYNPDFGDAHLNQGIALLEMGRLSEAVGSLEKGIRLRPDRADVKALLDEVRRVQSQAESPPAPR